MSGVGSFHPNSYSTDDLRVELKLRLPSIDFERMNREKLVSIFESYVTPIHQRSRNVSTAENTGQSSQLAAQRIVLKRKADTITEKTNGGCKRTANLIKRDDEMTPKKRLNHEDIQKIHGTSPVQPKRKKITWP